MVINKLHIKSLEAPHPDLVVSEPLRLTDQRGVEHALSSSTFAPRVTSYIR